MTQPPSDILPYTRVVERRVTIGFNQRVQLCTSNANRWLLAFAAASTSGDVRLRWTGVPSDRGIRLAVNEYREFWVGRHGPLATFEWFGEAVGGSGDVWVIEVIYQPPRRSRR